MTETRTVLVTGTSRGFGALLTIALVERGHQVVATMREPEGRNAPAAERLREQAGGGPGRLHILELDVTSDDSVERAVRATGDLASPIDVLVHNAGQGASGLLEAHSVEQMRGLFETNVFGVQRLSRAVLPGMRQRRSGLVVFMSSTMGRMVIPFSGPYTSAKFAIEAMAETYRYELSGSGVDVAIVEPGAFDTGFHAAMLAPDDREREGSYGAMAFASAGLWGGLTRYLQGEAGPDPRRVADAIADLVEADAGQRPLRTVVDPMTGGHGATSLNRASSTVQSMLLKAMGLGGLMGPLL